MIHPEVAYPLADLALTRRLERTEALMNAAFVEARAALETRAGPAWTDVAGAYAMFDGAGSPLTQTFGLGLFNPVGPAEMQALESFFEHRGPRSSTRSARLPIRHWSACSTARVSADRVHQCPLSPHRGRDRLDPAAR